MTASFLGAISATYSAGIAAGAIGEKMGKKVNKKVGSVIGFVAGAGGGMIAGITVNKLTGLFKEDDCVIVARLLNAVVVDMAIDYFMSEEEINKLIELLDKDSKKINKLQLQIRKSEQQYFDIKKFLEPYFEQATADRKHISEKDEENAFYEYNLGEMEEN